tara:strand:- start:2005 stop:4071 length:2067 start_codon:yes stop_codon:yes gene_type:complete
MSDKKREDPYEPNEKIIGILDPLDFNNQGYDEAPGRNENVQSFSRLYLRTAKFREANKEHWLWGCVSDMMEGGCCKKDGVPLYTGEEVIFWVTSASNYLYTGFEWDMPFYKSLALDRLIEQQGYTENEKKRESYKQVKPWYAAVFKKLKYYDIANLAKRWSEFHPGRLKHPNKAEEIMDKFLKEPGYKDYLEDGLKSPNCILNDHKNINKYRPWLNEPVCVNSTFDKAKYDEKNKNGYLERFIQPDNLKKWCRPYGWGQGDGNNYKDFLLKPLYDLAKNAKSMGGDPLRLVDAMNNLLDFDPYETGGSKFKENLKFFKKMGMNADIKSTEDAQYIKNMEKLQAQIDKMIDDYDKTDHMRGTKLGKKKGKIYDNRERALGNDFTQGKVKHSNMTIKVEEELRKIKLKKGDLQYAINHISDELNAYKLIQNKGEYDDKFKDTKKLVKEYWKLNEEEGLVDKDTLKQKMEELEQDESTKKEKDDLATNLRDQHSKKNFLSKMFDSKTVSDAKAAENISKEEEEKINNLKKEIIDSIPTRIKQLEEYLEKHKKRRDELAHKMVELNANKNASIFIEKIQKQIINRAQTGKAEDYYYGQGDAKDLNNFERAIGFNKVQRMEKLKTRASAIGRTEKMKKQLDKLNNPGGAAAGGRKKRTRRRRRKKKKKTRRKKRRKRTKKKRRRRRKRTRRRK